LIKNIAHIAHSLAVRNIKKCVKIANAVEVLKNTWISQNYNFYNVTNYSLSTETTRT